MGKGFRKLLTGKPLHDSEAAPFWKRINIIKVGPAFNQSIYLDI
jgi:hypothetical protein